MQQAPGMSELSESLSAVEAHLVEQIPASLANYNSTASHYALFLQYVDYSCDPEVPVVIFGTVDDREQRLKDSPDMVWIPEFGLADIQFDDHAIVDACKSCYRLMQEAADDFDEDDVILLPLRKMLYRACGALLKHEAISNLNPTDDFVVTAIDAAGYWYDQDLSHCVTPERIQLLQNRGFYPS